MGLPNDSITVTPGTGATVATHTVSSKEYQVVMTSDADGQIRGSLPAWGLIIPPQAAAASKIFFDVYNTSANLLRLRKLFIYSTGAVVTGTFAVRFDVFRTSAVGTSGTTAATTANTSTTTAGFFPFTTGNTLPAGVTARLVPTGGATSEQWMFPAYVQAEETHPSATLSQYYNFLPELSTEQSIELPTNKGLKVVEDATASPVGTFGMFLIFTVE